MTSTHEPDPAGREARRFSTRAIHVGSEPDSLTGAVVPPIYQTSTYAQDGVGGLRSGYEYSRSANPTRTALERCFASLEGGRAFAFASGLAGQDTVQRALLRPGDHVLVPTDVYGGTYRAVDQVLQPWGVVHDVVAIADTEAVAAAMRPDTRMIWVESPTNPLLGIADIPALARIAHAAGALLVVDNTFATPYLQQPIPMGADIVVHSTTKYAGGHSDVIGGVVVVAPNIGVAEYADAADRIAFHQNAMGAIAGPFDCWLVLRGLKTLALRMEQHCTNAERIADHLAGHPAVTHVYYPGMAGHPGRATAARQMRRFGGIVSFQAAGGERAAVEICGATRTWILGESLGGVESLIEHPARMTHASVRGTLLEVPPDVVRLSVGIEDADDLIDDLDQALTRASAGG